MRPAVFSCQKLQLPPPNKISYSQTNEVRPRLTGYARSPRHNSQFTSASSSGEEAWINGSSDPGNCRVTRWRTDLHDSPFAGAFAVKHIANVQFFTRPGHIGFFAHASQ